MHLTDAFTQSDLLQAIHFLSVCVFPWESNPQTLCCQRNAPMNHRKCYVLRVTSLTHLLLMQMLITLQTVQNYNAIRNRKYEFIVYLTL